MWQTPPSSVKMAVCRTHKERCAATGSVGVSPAACSQPSAAIGALLYVRPHIIKVVTG